jgi:hypothetical protein
MADEEMLARAVEQVATEAGRLISEFGRKVHFREYADEKEVAEAIAHIVHVTITGVLEAVSKAAAEEGPACSSRHPTTLRAP